MPLQPSSALINASLMNLMRCLREMLNHQPTKKRGGASKGGVVPFRESKLTHMFMNHLTGPAASRTSMIVNVNPAADDYDETQHVLGYAATARNVTVSAVDYNKKRRLFAKEGKVKLKSASGTTSSPKKAIAKLAKRISPKKRKGTAGSSSKPQAKRLRSNSHGTAAALNNNAKKYARPGTAGARKPAPKPAKAAAPKSTKSNNDELERLREENFELKCTVEELEQKLEDCENEVREEVVATMNEQLQENKQYYESRIAKMEEQNSSLQSTSKQSMLDDHNDKADLKERIDECEEEMKRMREEHEKEKEDLMSQHLQLNNEHQAAMETAAKGHAEELRAEQAKKKKLEAEIGTLRHQQSELKVGHDALLAKYEELKAAQNEAAANQEKENPPAPDGAKMPESPGSFRKLSRKRASDVASVAGSVEIAPSPKSGKKQRLFGMIRSPAKVGPGGKKSPVRSPMGNVNKK